MIRVQHLKDQINDLACQLSSMAITARLATDRVQALEKELSNVRQALTAALALVEVKPKEDKS